VLVLDEVVEALAVDVPRPGTSGWLALFVTLREGAELDDRLVAAVKDSIRRGCSARHVPDEVVHVPDVPRTLSGKILEVPVKRILMGEAPERVAAPGTLANPESLRFFVEHARELSEAPR
jgi:acetoacetyl-CoA synthetase